MLRYLPLSSAISPPREIDGLLRIRLLPGVCATAPKKTVRGYKFPGTDVKLAFLHVLFSSVFESFYLATACSHTIC